MAKKNDIQAEEVDPKILAMFDSAENFDGEALERAGFESKNVNAVTMPEGTQIHGKLISVGGFDVVDKKTRQPKHVTTFEIETAKGKVLISAGAVLESKMKGVALGSEVHIARLANVQSSSGNDMGDYRVFVK